MNIKPLNGGVLIKIPQDSKDYYELIPGVTIRWLRYVDNPNQRETKPVNGFIVEGLGLPEGTEVLVDYKATHPTYEIFDHDIKLEDGVKLFCIPAEEVYLQREKYDEADEYKGWHPCEGILMIERVFKPCRGIIYFPPEQLPNTVFCVRGAHQGKVLRTDLHCDYTIIFQEQTGREGRITRMRNNEYEVLAIDEGSIEKVLSGELIIGETPESAKVFSSVLA